MAAIDKIYASHSQHKELFEWCEKNMPEVLANGLYPIDFYPDMPDDKHRAVSNFPSWVDKHLFENCPIGWVKERIADQYSITDGKWDDLIMSWCNNCQAGTPRHSVGICSKCAKE